MADGRDTRHHLRQHLICDVTMGIVLSKNDRTWSSTALSKATGNQLSIFPLRTLMITRQRASTSRNKPKDEPPGSDGFMVTGEGRPADSTTLLANDAVDPNPHLGRSSADVLVAERSTGFQKLRQTKLKIGTWNVRSMSLGKLEIVKREMTRCEIDILGVSELKWNGMGHFNSTDHSVYFCGNEKGGRNGVGIICSSEISRCVLGYNPVSDRIISIRIQGKPINISIIMVYAPTSAAEIEELEDFYDKVQEVLDEIPKGDILYILGDWNAKVGKQPTQSVTGEFGLGERNDRGEYLIDFCVSNNLAVMNTFFKMHKRRLFTWTSPDKNTKNQIDYVICQQRWKSSICRVSTRPGADCGSDHNLLVAEVKVKLKSIQQTKRKIKFDLGKIAPEYNVEIKNRFEVLSRLDEDNVENYWESIKSAVTEVAEKHISKQVKKKKTHWLSKEALNIADERRRMKHAGNDAYYSTLNSAFQKQARKDKQKFIEDTCTRLEILQQGGKTRDFYKEIKQLTGIFDPRCGAVYSQNGKVCADVNSVKYRWKEYTENLYSRDSTMTDTFIPNVNNIEPTILECEVRSALQSLANGKTAGSDNIPIELIKEGGEEAVKVITKLCNKIWQNKVWPEDWKRSIFIPLFKKGDRKDCGNYRTISLISHTSKVLLKILQKRLEDFLSKELPEEQAGFKRGRGTRDHIANLRRIMERQREFGGLVYMCFIDYRKAFDSVDHDKLWNNLISFGAPPHLVSLLHGLYKDQLATVMTEHGETEPFKIGKGVRQGCILSPLLFNLYAEMVVRKVEEDCDCGIRIGGRTIWNLRYADDTTLIADTKINLTKLLISLKEHSANAGLHLNFTKTKVMTTGPADDFVISIDGHDIEVVDTFKFLGSTITSDSRCEKDIRRRISLGKSAVRKLEKVWKDRGVSKQTKIKLMRVLVFPVFMYSSETWVIRKADRKRIDAFELWCWRRLLRVSWRERRSNQWILDTLDPGEPLEKLIVTSALKYFGHVCRRYNSLERDIMLGMVPGTRMRGRPRARWLDGILQVLELQLPQAIRLAGDRDAWRVYVKRVTRGRTRLDGTR